jgi:hypothetical protein
MKCNQHTWPLNMSSEKREGREKFLLWRIIFVADKQSVIDHRRSFTCRKWNTQHNNSNKEDYKLYHIHYFHILFKKLQNNNGFILISKYHENKLPSQKNVFLLNYCFITCMIISSIFVSKFILHLVFRYKLKPFCIKSWNLLS